MSTIDFAIIDKYDNEYDYSDIIDVSVDWEDALRKLNAISIDSDLFYCINRKLKRVPTLTCEHNPWTGISEYGITIIPPESLDICIKKTRKFPNTVYGDVIELFEKAKESNKYVICFA